MWSTNIVIIALVSNLAINATSSPSPSSSPSFWTSSRKYSRNNAKRYCHKNGGQLALIGNSKLGKKLLRVTSKLNQKEGWIGSFKNNKASHLFQSFGKNGYKALKNTSNTIKAYAFCQNVWDSKEWFFTSTYPLSQQKAVDYCKSKGGSIAHALTLKHLRHVKMALERRYHNRGWFLSKTGKSGFFLDLRSKGKPRVSRAKSNDKHYAVCQDSKWQDTDTVPLNSENPFSASEQSVNTSFSEAIDESGERGRRRGRRRSDALSNFSLSSNHGDTEDNLDSETIKDVRKSDSISGHLDGKDSDSLKKDSQNNSEDDEASTLGTWDPTERKSGKDEDGDNDDNHGDEDGEASPKKPSKKRSHKKKKQSKKKTTKKGKKKTKKRRMTSYSSGNITSTSTEISRITYSDDSDGNTDNSSQSGKCPFL